MGLDWVQPTQGSADYQTQRDGYLRGDDAASEALQAQRTRLAGPFAESLAQAAGGGTQGGENAQARGHGGGEKKGENQDRNLDRDRFQARKIFWGQSDQGGDSAEGTEHTQGSTDD